MRHLTTAEVQRAMASSPSAAEAESIGSHIAQCSECALMFRDVLSLPHVVAFIDAALPPGHDDADHLDDDEIADFAAGALRGEERQRVLEHLHDCVDCRNEVAVLRRWATRRRLRSALTSSAFLAIAASVLVVSVTTFVVHDRTSVPEVRRTVTGTPRVSAARPPAPAAPSALPEPPHVGNAMSPEWRALVDRARRTGELPFPRDLRDLAARDSFRGGASEPGADHVWPRSTAVTHVKPRFVWQAVAGAEYIVTLNSDRGVTRSETLRESEWRPSVPLTRGTTYSWQVDVKKGDEVFSIPAPPAPPAIFRVITSREADEIDRAARHFADDHLLLGLLHAKAGLVDEARRHLNAWRRTSGDPAAARLLAQLPTP
ncbi:MAG TPA: zf-HC2 domain-containing protein [Thermoanaerobaculia bacterium]|nr:zf-HC2 domain-containing protein [Thermoanaerobaculia bacterium]